MPPFCGFSVEQECECPRHPSPLAPVVGRNTCCQPIVRSSGSRAYHPFDRQPAGESRLNLVGWAGNATGGEVAQAAVRAPLDQLGPVEQKAREWIDRYGVTLRSVTAIAAAVFCLLGERVSAWQLPICVAVIGWAIVRLRGGGGQHPSAARGRSGGRLLRRSDHALDHIRGRGHQPNWFRDQCRQSRQPDLDLEPSPVGGRAATRTVIGCYLIGAMLVEGIEFTAGIFVGLSCCPFRRASPGSGRDLSSRCPGGRPCRRGQARHRGEIDVTNARRAADASTGRSCTTRPPPPC